MAEFNKKKLQEAIENRNKAESLIRRIMSGKTSSLREKVGYLLMRDQKARDSDIGLVIKLYKTFYPYLIDKKNKIKLSDLHELPRAYDIQRYRAEIQNTFGLFLASPEVQQKRKKRAEDFRELFSQTERQNEIRIFADESGKTESTIVIGSLWIYGWDDFVKFSSGLAEWRQENRLSGEFHFQKVSKINFQNTFEFFKYATEISPFCRYIALVIPISGSDAGIQTNIFRGYSELLLQGLESEVNERNVSLPVSVKLTKDAEEGADGLELPTLVRRVNGGYSDLYERGQASLDEAKPEGSGKNDLIQTADIFTGAINRWINVGVPNPEGNPKEKLAAMIGSHLGFTIESGSLHTMNPICKVIDLGSM